MSPAPKAPDQLTRFLDQVDKDGPLPHYAPFLGPCWIWTGTKNQKGYGILLFRGVTVQTHRYVYEEFVGPIPDGFYMDHLCRVPSCVRPEHLEPVTPRENVLRGYSPPAMRARQTHCKWGHEFTPENTIITRGGRGRRCRACRDEHHRTYVRPSRRRPATA